MIKSDARVSVGLGGLATIDEMVRATVAAEAAGAHAVWLPDHLAVPAGPVSPFPYEGGALRFDADAPFPDVWSMIAYLSAITERIRLGVGVLVVALRHPFVTARAAATVQLLSGGRLLVGVGAGWLEEEFRAVGVDFDRRGTLLDSAMDISRDLWTGEPVQRESGPYPFDNVRLHPVPDVPPPVYVGGASRAAMRRAADAEGWYAPACSLAEAEAARATIEQRRGADEPFDYVIRPATLDPSNIRAFRGRGFDHLAAPVSAVRDTWGGSPDIEQGVTGLVELLRGKT